MASQGSASRRSGRYCFLLVVMVWKVAIVVPQKKVDGVSAREGKEKRLPFRKGLRVRKRGSGVPRGEIPQGIPLPPRQVGSGVLRQSQRTFVGGTLFAGLAVLGLFKGEVDELERPFAFRLAQEGVVQLMA